jgi:rod shape-determining protein MreC
VISAIAEPFHWVAGLSNRLSYHGQDHLVGRRTLLERNTQLEGETLLLRAKLQKFATLEAENDRLRKLLNSSALVDDNVLVAELIGVSPDPMSHEIIVNKGSTDNVYIGQPVIDALGLMGQVVAVGPNHSRVLLISDASHAVPVQVNRNGVRSIAEGNGRYDQLTLRHVATTSDIQVGDLLVSSGLGQRFPAGYPVATVTEVSANPGQPFAKVTAQPTAQLTRGRYVLLVFTH